MAGLVGERAVQGDGVRGGEELVELDTTSRLGVRIDGVDRCDILLVTGVVDDVHAKCSSASGHRLADLSQADDAEGGSLQTSAQHEGVVVTPGLAGTHPTLRLAGAAGDLEQQGERKISSGLMEDTWG